MQSDFVVPSVVLVDLSQSIISNDYPESCSVHNTQRKTESKFQSPLPLIAFNHNETSAHEYSASQTMKEIGAHISELGFDFEDFFERIGNDFIDSNQKNINLVHGADQNYSPKKSGTLENATSHLPIGRPLAPPPKLPMMILTNESSKRKIESEINGSEGRRGRIKFKHKCQ
jgi:hypothetical protein